MNMDIWTYDTLLKDLEEDNFPPCPINVNNNIKHGNINSNNNNFNANKQAFINSEITH